MMLSRRLLVAASWLTLATGLTACPKKEEPAPAPPKVATPVAEPSKPPPPAEARAVKECAAPLEPAAPTPVTIAERQASAAGYKLSFSDKDADGTLTLGVLGPLNEDSGQNLLAVRKYLKFFQDEKVDAILVTGDVGEIADGIARVLRAVAEAKVPVMVIAGNRECRAEFTDGVLAARRDRPNLVNMNEVRMVEFPELTIVSLPGYHDPNYINCATGCRYHKSTVDEVVRMAKEAKGPTLLLAHGPPHGEGSQALDYASAGGNVGDAEINRAIAEANIAFGTFSNIKESGARATSDAAGTTQLKPSTPSKTLYLNPGPADTVGWEMNDSTKSVGLAAVFLLKDGQGSYKVHRLKPMSAAEKAEAKKLDPPARPEGAEAPAPAPAPTPPPGQPATP